MTTKGIRRLPVVDSSDGLVGIITLDDLLLLLAKEFGALTKLISREQKNETSKRP
jgi:CBS domain-containing protein